MSLTEQLVLHDNDPWIIAGLDCLSTGFWSFDIESRISRWNSSLYRLLGREIGDYPPGPEAGLNLIHPDDRNFVHHEMSLAISTIGHGLEYLCRMQHCD